ncbi:MAG TPA: VanZ family protein [Gemmatimonadaceae bacterium]|nr:VanZ family protein [Gemmatimonadaceae bacterium]
MWRWVPPLLWAAFILVLTSIPGSMIPSVGIPNLDKLVHLTLYGVLGLLTARAVWRPGAKRVALTVALGISLFGALDEWHQQFIPGRSMEVLDWTADTLGAACGIAVASILRGRDSAS